MERGNIIAAAGSLVALLIGTGFVFLYTAMKIKIFKAISGGTLPGACLFFHSLTLPALFVPAGFGAVFALLIKQQKFNQQATAIFVTASCLFTLSWMLLCLLVWELPNLPFLSNCSATHGRKAVSVLLRHAP